MMSMSRLKMIALPAWQDWAAQAQAEPWVIDKYEID
jgi:hypothetical protein